MVSFRIHPALCSGRTHARHAAAVLAANLLGDCVLYLRLALIHTGLRIGNVYCSYDPLHPRELSRATGDGANSGGGELSLAGVLRDQSRATKKLIAIL